METLGSVSQRVYELERAVGKLNNKLHNHINSKYTKKSINVIGKNMISYDKDGEESFRV